MPRFASMRIVSLGSAILSCTAVTVVVIEEGVVPTARGQGQGLRHNDEVAGPPWRCPPRPGSARWSAPASNVEPAAGAHRQRGGRRPFSPMLAWSTGAEGQARGALSSSLMVTVTEPKLAVSTTPSSGSSILSWMAPSVVLTMRGVRRPRQRTGSAWSGRSCSPRCGFRRRSASGHTPCRFRRWSRCCRCRWSRRPGRRPPSMLALSTEMVGLGGGSSLRMLASAKRSLSAEPSATVTPVAETVPRFTRMVSAAS